MKDLQIHLTPKYLNLADPIRARYGNLDKLPPTNNSSTYLIDCIFVSPDLMNIKRGDWFEFGEGHSYH